MRIRQETGRRISSSTRADALRTTCGTRHLCTECEPGIRYHAATNGSAGRGTWRTTVQLRHTPAAATFALRTPAFNVGRFSDSPLRKQNASMKIKFSLLIIVTIGALCRPTFGQTLSFDPGLPNTSPLTEVSPAAAQPLPSAAVSTAGLSRFVGTYVGVVVYYNINSGVGDWEVVFDRDGTIRLSDKFQTKYPNARVSGRFLRNGTFTYTNQQTDGLTFTTTGKINSALQKLTATFTSTSAGTGVLLCNKL
jgi:hypothetical protein